MLSVAVFITTLSFVILNVIMLNVVIQNVIMLNVIMLNVIMLIVVALILWHETSDGFANMLTNWKYSFRHVHYGINTCFGFSMVQ
jgi:hypothetical protein